MSDGDGRASSGAASTATARSSRSEDGPEPTHCLHLADGRIIDHAGAIPTHYSDDKGTVPVVAAYEKVSDDR